MVFAGIYRRVGAPVIEAARNKLTEKESRIGKAPIKVPAGITVTLDGKKITVSNKRLEMSETLPDVLSIEEQEDKTLRVRKLINTRNANKLHGLFRSLANNMIVGLSEGYMKELQLIGVGYRAQSDGKNVTLFLGYSHPILLPIPSDVEVTIKNATTVQVSSHNKCSVGDFAAKIRSKRKPEPYKGKGVRYTDEFVRRKEGKRGK